MRRGWRKLERRTVLVNLRNGSAIRGVLLDARAPLLQLANAVLLEPEAKDAAKIDGTAAIDLSQVAWVQVLAPSEP
jgi:small nuclear ribonucleoprotein (snRNP)-like protein